jgi:hypothetical protein
MKRTLSLLALVGLVAAPGAQAQEAEGNVFRPVGNWTADYGNDYCRLLRTFSNGKDEVSLALERTAPGTNFRLILVGGGISPYRRATELGYHFLPSGDAKKGRYVKSETADGKQYLSFDQMTLVPFVFTPPAPGTPPAPPPPYNRQAELDAARPITGIALAEGLTDPVRFETGSLRAPVAALQACADDLIKTWGLDPDKHKAMTAAATLVPNSDGVLPQGTIPFTEFEKFGGGANQVRLLVGADGKPTSCTIYQPSLSQSMNEKICKLAMERATFSPAKDAGGQAMASYWMGSPMFLGPPLRGRGPGGGGAPGGG